MVTNTNNIEDEVRRRAYELWEQYGRPEGGEEEFWCRAEREIKQAKGLTARLQSRRKPPLDQTGKIKPGPQSRQGE